MKDVTAIITAHYRPVQLRNAIRSIRKFYPDMRLIVIADGAMTGPTLKLIEQDGGITLVWFESEDMGVSALRNRGAELVATKYTLVLEDDFIFTEQTKIEELRNVLEEDREATLCCGSLKYLDGRARWFANRLILDEVGKCYETVPIRKPKWREARGTRYFHIEYAFNFFLMRTEEHLRWDPELKIAIEHIDFFIRLKKAGKKAAIAPGVCAVHDCRAPNKRYRKDRRRLIYWERFCTKHGYRHGINHEEMTVYDLKAKKPMPYPQFIFYLMNRERGRSQAAKPSALS